MTQDYAIPSEPVELSRVAACRDWLGIENPIPTYYELLGLPGLESDADAIFEAGREVKRKLRSYQAGRYKAQALELLADVGQAVSILTNPQKKRAYDADLLRGWRTAAVELYDRHLAGRVGDPAALQAWLTACRGRGMPVVRLMSVLLRDVRPRGSSWPNRGPHGVDLLTALGLYRDVVVLGQCVEAMPLAKRVQSVKRAQQALGIPEALARIVAEGMARSRRPFEALRLVRESQRDPEAVVLRLARRMRRCGGTVSPRNKALVAVARLLGQHRQDLPDLLDRLEDPTVDLSPSVRAARLARRARAQAHGRARDVRFWVVDHPQLLVVAAIAVGVLTFTLAVLVVLGVWHPWHEPAGAILPPPARPETEVVEPPALLPPPPDVTPAEPTSPSSETAPAVPSALGEFIRDYPAEGPAPADTAPPETPPPDAPPETVPPDAPPPAVAPPPPPPSPEVPADTPPPAPKKSAPGQFFGIPHD